MKKKYKEMAAIYKRFVENSQEELRKIRERQGREFIPTNYDFSEKALNDIYEYESSGKGKITNTIFEQSKNGYFQGKKLMDLYISWWREDLPKGLLFKEELYDDWYPREFLDKVLRGVKCLFDDMPKILSGMLTTITPSSELVTASKWAEIVEKHLELKKNKENL